MTDQYRVLIVDDTKAMRIMLKDIILRNGITSNIYEAENAKQAFAAFPEICPDLILMDLFMPGENGLEAIRKIHALDPTIAIMVVTASTDLHDTKEAIQNGAVDVIKKPFSPHEVGMKIQKILRDKDKRIADLYNKTTKLLVKLASDPEQPYAPGGADKTHLEFLKKKVEGKS